MKNIENIKDIKNIITKIHLSCRVCGKDGNQKIGAVRNSPSFDGHEANPFEKPTFFFCCQEHKKEWVKDMRERDKRNMPYLAELDESMNYCEYFERTTGNEGIYKRDGFEHQVNGLWDYKSWERIGAKEFKQAYIKHFGNFNRFKLHNRYDYINKSNKEK